VKGALGDVREHPYAYAILLALMSGAAWMRLANLASISFLIDPAWDLIWVDKMLHQHCFPLLGQRMTSGGYLGPAMLYMMAPVGLLSGDPEAFAAFFALTNVVAVLLAFYIARRYFSLRAGLLSALLLGYNLHAIIASRGIWNPFLVPMFSGFLTLALFRFFVDGASGALIGIALCLSLLLQLHAHTAVLIPYCVLLAWLLPWPRVRRVVWRSALLLPAVLLILPLLTFDLSNDFYNTTQILNGLFSLQPATSSAASRAWSFLTMGVFSDRLFRFVFLFGVVAATVDVLARWNEPIIRAKRLILLLPATLLFGAMVALARIPLVPRFIGSLVVPSAILCGVTLDDLVRRGGRWWPWRPTLLNAALVAAGVSYVAVVARAYTLRRPEYGYGHLATIRAAAQRVIDDSRSRTVATGNVFVCENGTRDLAEYGRSYGYVLKLLSRQAALPDRPAPVHYMISSFVQANENRIGMFEGVAVYRFPDLVGLAEFVRRFPHAVCHRAVAENFPFRTG